MGSLWERGTIFGGTWKFPWPHIPRLQSLTRKLFAFSQSIRFFSLQLLISFASMGVLLRDRLNKKKSRSIHQKRGMETTRSPILQIFDRAMYDSNYLNLLDHFWENSLLLNHTGIWEMLTSRWTCLPPRNKKFSKSNHIPEAMPHRIPENCHPFWCSNICEFKATTVPVPGAPSPKKWSQAFLRECFPVTMNSKKALFFGLPLGFHVVSSNIRSTHPVPNPLGNIERNIFFANGTTEFPVLNHWKGWQPMQWMPFRMGEGVDGDSTNSEMEHSTNASLLVCCPVVWDSTDSPKNPNPFHFRGF